MSDDDLQSWIDRRREPPAADFADRVMARVEAAPRPMPRLAAAASMLLALGLGLLRLLVPVVYLMSTAS